MHHHFPLSLEIMTNTISFVYLLLMETELFGNSRSLNTTDIRRNWHIDKNAAKPAAGLGIRNKKY